MARPLASTGRSRPPLWPGRSSERSRDPTKGDQRGDPTKDFGRNPKRNPKRDPKGIPKGPNKSQRGSQSRGNSFETLRPSWGVMPSCVKLASYRLFPKLATLPGPSSVFIMACASASGCRSAAATQNLYHSRCRRCLQDEGLFKKCFWFRDALVPGCSGSGMLREASRQLLV